MLNVETIQKNPEPTQDEDLQEINTTSPEEEVQIKPSDILCQILYRPQDAIHKRLLDSSYAWVDDGMAITRLEDPFGGWINMTRNWQTKLFLKRPRFKWLFLVDQDVGVPYDVPYRLASHNLPICSAIVPGFTKERGIFACVAVKDPKGVARFPTLNETKTLPLKGIVELHNAGTGCLMIRRDVLETLWDRFEQDPGFGQPFELPMSDLHKAGETGVMPKGEDICFTDRCREAGFKIFADFAARCIHEKTFQIAWPDDAVADISVDDWCVSALDYKVVQP